LRGFFGSEPADQGTRGAGPDPNWADKLRLFGQFVGNWDCEVTLIQPDGSKVNGSCGWHFGWILQGSAIQDVWIAHYQGAVSEERRTTRGTTVRWYDPKADLT
jgi:hypothetical protein